MSSSRAFSALMSMLACAAILAAVASEANASATDATGTTETAESTIPLPEAPAPEVRRGPVVLKIGDRSVNFGGKFRLRGKTGVATRGHVKIQARVGKAWHTLRKVQTDSEGRFKTRVGARANTHLRAKTADGRKSEAKKVSVIGHVKLAKNEPYVRLGDRLAIRGTVVPRGVRTVKVRVRGEGVVTTRTRSSGRFVVRWKPSTNGDYSYRVRALPSAKSTGDASRTRSFSALRPGHASYYGPGLYGNGVACGGTLLPSTRGVAHKTLPCGTKVTLQYGNRTVVARVIDRGPYIAGRDWDLTEQTRNDLGFGGVGVVWTDK